MMMKKKLEFINDAFVFLGIRWFVCVFGFYTCFGVLMEEWWEGIQGEKQWECVQVVGHLYKCWISGFWGLNTWHLLTMVEMTIVFKVERERLHNVIVVTRKTHK